MTRATGILMEDEKDPFSLAVIGKYSRTVTIELSRGMKVIGTCKTCEFFLAEGDSIEGWMEANCLHPKTAIAVSSIRYKGCGLWCRKARKK